MTRLVVLTGAPTSSTLRWDENALSEPGKPNHDGAVDSTESPEALAAYSAHWRQVPTRNEYDGADHCLIGSAPFVCPGRAISPPVKLTSETDCQHARTLARSGIPMASIQTTVEGLDDFYAQSFALHEGLTASQLSEFRSRATSQTSPQCSSDVRTQVGISSPVELGWIASPFSISPHQLSEVKDIKSAEYLQSIEPQTMTVNLVVGVITLSSPRRVTVGRRWRRARETQLLDMLVGDDTRAGFEITMWLSDNLLSNGGLGDQSTLESQMRRLRPQDIVLLRNVALGAYQGKVRGQSLRRGVTKVDLLYRRQVDEQDEEGVYSSKEILGSAGQDPVLKKAQRVKLWLMNFVGDDVQDGLGEASTTRQALLPPDTQ